MAYDPVRDRVFLFGGAVTAIGLVSDTWAWDGQSWAEVTPQAPLGSPGTRAFHRMVFDHGRDRTVLFGGGGPPGLKAGPWEWDGGADARPAQVMRVRLGAGAMGSNATIETVRLDVLARGTSVNGDGVELLAWREGAWASLVTSSASGMQNISWSSADAAEARSLELADGMHFAIATAGTNGTGRARLDLDYAEVSVRYRVAP